jgi:hypothetical protein
MYIPIEKEYSRIGIYDEKFINIGEKGVETKLYV